jgi:hypothetical protein
MLGVLTTPLISDAFAASIVTCFVPEQDCATLVIGHRCGAGRDPC